MEEVNYASQAKICALQLEICVVQRLWILGEEKGLYVSMRLRSILKAEAANLLSPRLEKVFYISRSGRIPSLPPGTV
jgi:hypothetical protein